jgi:hypothetical protein
MRLFRRGAHTVADIIANLSGVVGATAAASVLPLILRTVRPAAAEVDGKFVLNYGRPMKVLAGVLWVCWLSFFVATLMVPPEVRALCVAVVLGFLLLPLPLHLEFVGVRVEFDESGIRTRSPWRPKREIPWSAINQVWFSPILQWYVVQTRGFGRIRLHTYLNGVEALLTELEARGVPVRGRPAA